MDIQASEGGLDNLALLCLFVGKVIGVFVNGQLLEVMSLYSLRGESGEFV